MRTNRFLRLIALGAAIAYSLCSAAVSPAVAHEVGIPSRWATDELTNRMKRVRSGVADQRLTLREMEEEHLKLLKEFGSPREKGRIFAHLADLLREGKDKDPDKVIKYAKLALQQPLDVMDAISMHLRIADGLAYKYRGIKEKDYAGPRRQIHAPHLRALRIVLDNLTQSEEKRCPQLSLDLKGYGPAQDAEAMRAIKQREEAEIAECDRIETQNELLREKELLIINCVSAYAHPAHRSPADLAELERMAREILTPAHEDVTREIMKRVNAAIQDGYITMPAGGKVIFKAP